MRRAAFQTVSVACMNVRLGLCLSKRMTLSRRQSSSTLPKLEVALTQGSSERENVGSLNLRIWKKFTVRTRERDVLVQDVRVYGRYLSLSTVV